MPPEPRDSIHLTGLRSIGTKFRAQIMESNNKLIKLALEEADMRLELMEEYCLAAFSSSASLVSFRAHSVARWSQFDLVPG